ncbi:MAG TPA: phosphatase PAP2 family protein [Thermodesulfobacteriota bacterium]|nr:phosphatase PAP2 family protein [Thermodesulfobacteriota bacterium]
MRQIHATILYGMIAIFALHFIKRWHWQVFVVLLAVLLVILVSLSRVYLGYHYLSDTLAAVAIGIAWLSLCFMATTTLRKTGRKV